MTANDTWYLIFFAFGIVSAWACVSGFLSGLR